MAVYHVKVFDSEWRMVFADYISADDRQQAKLRAERYMDSLDAKHFELRKIR